MSASILAVVAVGGEQHFAVLLEVHQPVRHLQVADVEDQPGGLERRRIFAVRVDHQDVPVGRGLADAVQDQRRAGRLAGTGRAEQREVLAKHGVDIEPGADVLGGIDGADLDVRASVAGVDLLQIGGGRRIDQRARHRVARDAAAETVDAAGQLLLVAFAEEIDVGEHPATAAVLLLVADAGEQPRVADTDLDLAADLPGQRDRRVVIVHAFVEPLRGRARSASPNPRFRAPRRSAASRCHATPAPRPHPHAPAAPWGSKL